MRARFLLIVLVGVVLSVGTAFACGTCPEHLTHRTGGYSVRLAPDRAVYTIGQPIHIQLTLRNPVTAAAPLFVDPSAQVPHFALHIVAPNYAGAQADKARAAAGKPIRPGASRTLPARVLQGWGFTLTRRGVYHVTMAYGHVDSNVVTFTVR